MKSSFQKEPLLFKSLKSQKPDEFDINNIDYNQVFCTTPLRPNICTSPSRPNNDETNVLEFFRNNSYTDSIYGQEIANLLKEYKEYSCKDLIV